MSEKEIYQRIVRLFKEEKGEAFQIQLDSTLSTHIAADSVEMMEWILTIEEEFDVTIPDAAIEEFETLSDLVDFVYHSLHV